MVWTSTIPDHGRPRMTPRRQQASQVRRDRRFADGKAASQMAACGTYCLGRNAPHDKTARSPSAMPAASSYSFPLLIGLGRLTLAYGQHPDVLVKVCGG